MLNSAATVQAETLEQLMARFVDGDEAAFSELYERVSPALFGTLMRRTRDAEQVRDVVQTTFMKVFRAKDSYERGAPVLPWIHVIAKRTLIDEQRPLGARHEVLSNDGSLPDAPHPDSEREELDELLGIRRAFDQLPAQYRDAIGLTKVSGLTGGEAARQLQTTSAAIKQRVHRGYDLLRTWLSPVATTGDSDWVPV